MWFGGGVGIATLSIESSSRGKYSLDGYAFDLRIGHTFYANGKQTLDGSFEITPGTVSDGAGTRLSIASIGVLVGYQYL